MKNFSDNPNLDSYIETKRIIALVRRKLQTKKREKFSLFCESLNRDSSITYIWNKIKKFSSKNTNTQRKSTISDDIKFIILENMGVCDIRPEFSFVNYNENDIDDFSIQELDNSLQNKKLTAPGMDDISYLMIRNLPLNFKFRLLDIYNKILNNELEISSS